MTSGFQSVYCPETCPSEVKQTHSHFFICRYTLYAFHACPVLFAYHPEYKLANYFPTITMFPGVQSEILLLIYYVILTIWPLPLNPAVRRHQTKENSSLCVSANRLHPGGINFMLLSVRESEVSFYNKTLNSTQHLLQEEAYRWSVDKIESWLSCSSTPLHPHLLKLMTSQQLLIMNHPFSCHQKCWNWCCEEKSLDGGETKASTQQASHWPIRKK